MSTEYATWMADESVRNSLGELQHILDNAAGCIDELSGPKVMITDGPLEDGYVVSGVYSIEHGAKPETGLFFTSTQVENMRRAVTTLTKGPLEQALTQQRGEAAAHASVVPGRITDSLVSSVEAAMHACYMDHGDYRLTTTLLHDMAIAAVNVVAATPQPSADAVRELVKRWRISARVCGKTEYSDGAREAFSQCADELESLLSAASGEGVDDTKRLDWIARQGGYEFDFGILNDQPGDGDWFVHGMGGSGQGATFRDAIDAAIKEEAGGQDANTDILDTLAFKTKNGDAGRGSVTYIALVASGEKVVDE